MSLIGKLRTSTRLALMLPAVGLALSATFPATAWAQQVQPSATTPAFKGIIDLDVRKSTPDWAPYIPKTAPQGARHSQA